MLSRKTTALLSAATLLLISGSACKQKAAPADTAADTKTDAPAPTVGSATVSRAAVVEQTLPVTGTLIALRDRRAAVSAPVAGILDRLPVRIGQQLSKGDVVAHLSTTALTGQIQQAQATVAQNAVQIQQAQAGAIQQQAQSRTGVLQAQSAVSVAQAGVAGARATLAGNEAAVANAQQSLQRAQALFQEGLVAQKDLEAAQLAVRTATSQRDAQRQTVESQRQTVRSQVGAVAAARAASLQDAVKRKDVQIAQQQLRNAQGALETARAQLALYTVRAPLAGQVTAVGAGVGESVDTTTKVVTITDLRRLQLQIAIPGASAPEVFAGQTVRFTVDALPGRTFNAVIQSVGRQVDAQSNTVTATAVVDNSRRAFQEGTFARINVVTATHKNVLVVPRAALLATPGDNGEKATTNVMRIGSDGAVHQVAVTTGLSQGANVEITSGLKLGDRVATTGAYGLEDGTKVTVQDTAPAAKESQP